MKNNKYLIIVFVLICFTALAEKTAGTNNQLIRWFGDITVDSTIMGLTIKSCGLAEFLMVMFFLIGVVLNFLSHVVKFQSKLFDTADFSRMIALMFMILIYIPFVSFLNLVGVGSAKVMEKSEGDNKLFVEYLESQRKGHSIHNQTRGFENSQERQDLENKLNSNPNNLNSYNNDLGKTKDSQNQDKNALINGNDLDIEEINSDAADGDFDWWDYISGNPLHLLTALLNYLLYLLATVIRILMSAFMLNLLKILTIIGPLALAFSILPMFKEKFYEWLGTYLNILFSLLTFNILDHIVTNNITVSLFMLGGNAGKMQNSNESVIPLIVTNFVVCILYIMVPWITSKYVGSADWGKSMSKGYDMLMQGIQAFGAVNRVASSASNVGGGKNTSTADNAAQTGSEARG